jgi:hypothetical protein
MDRRADTGELENRKSLDLPGNCPKSLELPLLSPVPTPPALFPHICWWREGKAPQILNREIIWKLMFVLALWDFTHSGRTLVERNITRLRVDLGLMVQNGGLATDTVNLVTLNSSGCFMHHQV